MSDDAMKSAPAACAVYELVPMAHVADVERSIKFYELLGFSIRERIPAAGRIHWAWLTAGRGHLMLATADEPQTPARPAILLYLYTQDVAALRAHLLASGVANGGPYCGAPPLARPVVYEVSNPVYMPE